MSKESPRRDDDIVLLERLKLVLSEYRDVFETELIERRKNIQIRENIFKDLRKIKGFEGAGVYNREGDLIIAQNPNFNNIRESGFLAIDLYRDAIDGIERIRLGKFESFQIQTEQVVCIFSWLIPEDIFLEVIIDDDGDVEIFKRYLEKISHTITSFLYDN